MYRVIRPFDFFEPGTLDEALNLLSQRGSEAKILAGGVALVVDMRLRNLTPTYVISIQKIPDLDYIEIDKENSLKIGAMATLHSLERSKLIREEYPVLYAAIHKIHSVQAKVMGTAVGNICTATPASDVASVLIALGGRVKVVSMASERIISVEDFFAGVRQTVLGSDEMVSEIVVPAAPASTGYAFFKLTKTTADIGKLNVSASVTMDGDTCSDCRIALGSVAPTPMRARQAEQALKGRKPDEKTVSKVAEAAAGEAKPITDVWSTAEYRTEMIKVLVKRAINTAVEGAGQ